MNSKWGNLLQTDVGVDGVVDVSTQNSAQNRLISFSHKALFVADFNENNIVTNCTLNDIQLFNPRAEDIFNFILISSRDFKN